MGGGDGVVNGDVLSGGVAIVPFVVSDSVTGGVGGEVGMPEGGGKVGLPMEGRPSCMKGVVVRLL